MAVKKSLKRAVTVNEITKMKFKTMEFEGEFERMIGTPERSGSWIIWGKSGNGKTRFTLQLCKYLAQFCVVAYNSLEEGIKLSFKKAIEDTNMKAVNNKFIILSESMEELSHRLTKQRAPKIVVVDSFQYSLLNQAKYIELLQAHPSVLLIFISHAEGRNPKGNAAEFVRYNSDVKIHVEGYKAHCISRYGGGETYTIWEHGAEQYWGIN